MRLAAIGIGVGLAGSIGLARGLFGVGASDPATFVGVRVMLALVAAVARYAVTRR